MKKKNITKIRHNADIKSEEEEKNKQRHSFQCNGENGSESKEKE